MSSRIPKKFGSAALPSNKNCTWQAEPIYFFLGTKEQRQNRQQDLEALSILNQAILSEKYSIEELAKVYNDIIDKNYDKVKSFEMKGKVAHNGEGYVAPHLRQGFKTRVLETKKDVRHSIKLVDVADYVNEDEIRNLFRKYAITKVLFLKSKNTGEFCGVVIINFASLEDKKRCAEEMNGYRWNGMVIRIEDDVM